MYAVLSDSSRQKTVRKGDEILCDLAEKFSVGATVTFDEVLFVGDGAKIKIGRPTVAGAKVTGTVLREATGPKVVSMRFHRRKNVRVKRGHRQHYALVRIDSITA